MHKFKKSLGQNFITDTNLLNWIVAASGAGSDSAVLEIGAGSGTLTAVLAAKVKRVVAFEIDTELKDTLWQRLGDFDNVTIIFKDILKQDIAELENMLGGEYYIVSNLPYYITTPAIMRFLENSTRLKSMTLTVQKEVALRLCAESGSPDYGAITVAVDFYGGAKLLKNISRTLFYPVPNVDSAVIRIDINRSSIKVKDEALFKKLYKAAFAMRRKTLANNMAASFNISRQHAEEVILSCGFVKDIRGEKLSARDFAALSDRLSELI